MPSATEPTLDQAAALQARLDRLAARRATTPDGATGAAPKPTRRRHPAAGSRLAALGLSVASTSGLGAYFLATTTDPGTQLSAATVLDAPAATTTPPPTAPNRGTGNGAAAAADPATTSAVQGSAFQNRWGNVQVQASFAADGSLVAVDAVQTPGGRSRSVHINDHAVPRLEAEALAAQGAHIDSVSGATYTSTDYRRSLQSAIDAARQAGLTHLA